MFTNTIKVEWIAKENIIVNGANISKFLWIIFGSPFVVKYRRASVIHDARCQAKNEKWQDVHRGFNCWAKVVKNDYYF